MALLWVRILPREPFDFLSLVDRWNRRRQLRGVTRQGKSPWVDDAGKKLEAGKLTETDKRRIAMRESIHSALSSGDRDRALDTYERLLDEDDKQIMPRQEQLDLANHAMQQQRHGAAVRAYELYLERFGSEMDISEVQLLLGLIYTRYVPKPERARELLMAAQDKLTGDEQRKMAKDLLAQLSSNSDE
jgi:tetratricopeptide (TPR) repeat protein